MHQEKLHPSSPASESMDDVESPKFTVNQILLLQKLKQTGLTKCQIIKGLEEMEKLDEVGLGNFTPARYGIAFLAFITCIER